MDFLVAIARRANVASSVMSGMKSLADQASSSLVAVARRAAISATWVFCSEASLSTMSWGTDIVQLSASAGVISWNSLSKSTLYSCPRKMARNCAYSKDVKPLHSHLSASLNSWPTS
jgi:hypothetical protein